MKNTVTMAELMKKVTAYGQPQNLDEGFASDAQRRAAFASGYKEKGKKDKKEETLGEIKLSPPMIAKIKKTFEPLRDKKIGPSTQNKLMQTMDKIDKDKQTLVDLMNADIPFVSKLAVARLISKHNMKADQINKLRKEEVELDEKVDMQTKSYINDIVSAINRNPKLKYMKPFANKFKALAMKTGDVKKSLEAAMPDYVAGADIMRLLNMGDDILVRATANVLGERKIVNEDGHTDVASAIRQCKTMIEDAMQITSKLQGMNPEESLPSWWTNKLAIASNNMNKLRDYFLVPTTEEVQLDEKAGDIPDLKNLVGELVKASGMHLAQSKRVQAHVDMMVKADAKGPEGVGGLADLKKIVGELEKASEAHKRQSKSIDAHVKFMEKMEMKEYIEDELDERQHTNVSKKDADKVNSQMSKVLGKIRFTHVPNTKGGMFKLPPNVKHEITVDRNDMKDAAALLMKDKGDVGFMFKQGLIRITPSMAREVKEWFSKYNCDVKVREIHEGSNVYQAYVPISKTIPNKLRHLTLENQYGMIPEDVENLDNINYKNIKETSITMNGDFWNKLLTAYEEK